MARDALGLGVHLDAGQGVPALSRRQFLAATVTTSAAMGSARALPLSEGLLNIKRVEEPGFDTIYRTLLVSLGGQEWRIDPKLFGPSARLIHSPRELDQSHTLRLERAVFPGTGLRASFQATLYRAGGQWQIRLAFDEVGREVGFALFDWMAAPTQAESAGRYSGDMRTSGGQLQIGADACTVSAAKGPMTFTANAALTVTLSASGPLSLSCGRLKCAASSLVLSAVHADRVHPAHVPVLAHAQGPFSNIALNEVTCPGGELDLVGVGHLSAHLQVGEHLSATLVGHGRQHLRDATFILGGPKSTGALLLRGGASGPSGIRLPLAPWAIVGNVNRVREQLRFAAAVSTGGDEGHALETANLTALVSGSKDSLIELDLRHEWIEAIEIPVLLRGAHIPVANVSAASLVFAPAPALALIFGAPRTHPAPDLLAPRLRINRRSRLQLPLDQARLRVRRSADGVDLGFQLTHIPSRWTQPAARSCSAP